MNTERAWAEAAFPSETSVLRLRLRPYSCGHEINLSQSGSPFITGKEPSIIDLMLAVLICSQDFQGGQELLRDPKGGGWQLSIWRRMVLKSANPYAEEQRFIEYLNAGRWSPETVRVRERGVSYREMKAPRVYRLIPFLCRNLGLTEAEALNFPLSRANAYYAAEADREGTIDLASKPGDLTAEGQTLAWLEELEARAKKGENVWDF